MSEARIQALLEANNAELERRREVELDLKLAQRDVQAWRALYHQMVDECVALERELADVAAQRRIAF